MDEFESENISNSGHNQKNDEFNRSAIPSCPIDQNKTCCQQENTEKDENPPRHMAIQSASSVIMAICTFAIAIITAFYTYFAGQQVEVFMIPIKNSGNMSAREVIIRSAVRYQKHPVPDIDPFKMAEWGNVEGPINKIIGPQETSTAEGSKYISVEEFGAVVRREGVIFIMMEATYFDGFNKGRIIQMVRRIIFDDKGMVSAKSYGPHNCSDDDCSKQ